MVYFLASTGLSVEVIKMIKQIKEVTHQPLTPINTTITQKQLLDDLHYRQAKQIIQYLLDKGLISTKQFQKIDELNRHSFPPLFNSESVDTSTFQS